jgi:GNAT superfamily N-acetyltransferase
MSAYRFCRTDDVALLVEALNRCWAPYFPGGPAMTPAAFKRTIRDLQVWCSSCMVAFAGADPIGILIGAKRPAATLLHRIAVHPDHVRQGHARHLLDSISSKLAILGPPRLVAELPETNSAACALFNACGYTQEAVLTDYELDLTGAPQDRSSPAGLVIPATVDDLAANGLLVGTPSQGCWERAAETLTARKDDIAGLAVASDERLEAYVLYIENEAGAEILALRSLIDPGRARLAQLLSQLEARGIATVRFPKVHAAEVPREDLESVGFRATGTHRLYAARAHAG